MDIFCLSWVSVWLTEMGAWIWVGELVVDVDVGNKLSNLRCAWPVILFTVFLASGAQLLCEVTQIVVEQGSSRELDSSNVVFYLSFNPSWRTLLNSEQFKGLLNCSSRKLWQSYKNILLQQNTGITITKNFFPNARSCSINIWWAADFIDIRVKRNYAW